MLKNITARLIAMNFLQFFVWGLWLPTIFNYCTSTMGWKFDEFGIIYSTMGIASLFMPTIAGSLADRKFNAEKIYAVFHILSALALVISTTILTPYSFFWVILVAMMFYMPTIALSNVISYNALKKEGLDVVKSFPPIRVFGTIGFIVGVLVTNFTGISTGKEQLIFSGIAGVLLGIYSFTLPKCPPSKSTVRKGFFDFEAFKLLKTNKFLLFFLFSMLLGASLQLTNAYGEGFIKGFGAIKEYTDSFAVRNSGLIISISQISETLFILAIPFFLRRFGIKKVILFSMFAWVLRFGLFAYGNPVDGLWMIILSNIIYGMAFDFFNISGSLFIETNTDSSIRSSAQGLFMMMTNGIGAIIGSYFSGLIIANYFTDKTGAPMWQPIWLCFAAYSLVVALLFAVLFKHKHDPKELANIQH